MTNRRPITGSDLPAPLAACWRAIARHVSKTGKFPGSAAMAADNECSVSHATDMRRRLAERGYLAREGGSGTAALWRVLIWPAGVAPRDIACRAATAHIKTPPTKDDVERMLRLKTEDGLSISDIARETGHTVTRVEIALGLRDYRRKPPSAVRPKKRRRCLMCCHDFVSEGPGNHVCGDCKRTSRWRGGNDLSFDGPRAGRGA